MTADPLESFAAEVGDRGPVTCVGGRTQWDAGSPLDGEVREVAAPAGVVSFEPADMTVRVRAGTTVAELGAVLAGGGQMVPLDAADPERATVGGVLAVGHSGLRRLRYGPVRDTLLEARFVDARGRVVKAGGPVVKNVSGFDLCRVLVGSFGSLGFIGEVVLRAQPEPRTRRWLSGSDDPFAAARRLFRPSSVLWDGTTTWVLLEGHGEDVEAEAAALGPAFSDVEGPPPLDQARWRQSLAPGLLGGLTGRFVAEIGVGTVHRFEPVTPAASPGPTAGLNRRLKDGFDPDHRLNPGRQPVAAA